MNLEKSDGDGSYGNSEADSGNNGGSDNGAVIAVVIVFVLLAFLLAAGVAVYARRQDKRLAELRALKAHTDA